MTKTYAAKRLLEHGPLSFGEMREITGWRVSSLWTTLYRLMECDAVTFANIDGKRRYLLGGYYA